MDSAKTDDFEHVALIQRLDPDHIDDYIEAHKDVPDAVSDALERGGVEQFRLFVQGDISVGYIEVKDMEMFTEMYSNDSKCQEWEKRVGKFKRDGVDVERGKMPTMTEIWLFESE